MELINKDLLKEELNTRIEVLSISNFSHNSLMVGERSAYLSILSFLDTIEMKDVVAEQEGICNGILNTIIGDTWHVKMPLNKTELKHGDKVKIFITKEK